MKNKLNFFWFAALIVLLTGCQVTPPVEKGETPGVTPSSIEVVPAGTSTASVPGGEPEAGKSTVTGQVITEKTNLPLTNIVVRLAEVHRDGDEGAFLLDTAFSPGDITDEAGYFTFENIEPGEYVLVVGNVEVYGGYVIIPEESGRPLVYNFETDQVTDLGKLIVDLEQGF